MKYRNFVDDNWQTFNLERDGKLLFLFGCNRAKSLLCEMVQFGNVWEIEAILDNDETKCGMLTVFGKTYPVKKPQYLCELKKESIIVLLCGSYCGEMAIQLEEMGIKQYYSEFWMNRSDELRKPFCDDINTDIVSRLKAIVSDDKSKKIIDSIIEKRKEGFADYSDIMSRGSEYFSDEFWSPGENEVFVDAGGYDGDTIEEINEWTKARFKHIYCFEPQKDKAEIIKRNLWRYSGKVSLFEKGLWSSADKVGFVNGTNELSGRIGDGTNDYIETISLDDVVFEEVSFIKMDIEGAELNALIGAKKLIQRYNPKMAICIYHRLEDLWEIPFYIHELVPEYKMYIRHCSVSQNGTVLYALI